MSEFVYVYECKAILIATESEDPQNYFYFISVIFNNQLFG